MDGLIGVHRDPEALRGAFDDADHDGRQVAHEGAIFYGFSPAPKPELIAWARTPSPALSLAKGLDRDRGVDETGHQIAVFGRLGSRPFNRGEMERLFLNSRREPYFVTDRGTMDDWLPVRTAAPRSDPAGERGR